MVELLAASALTIILVGILLALSNLTATAVKQASAKLTAFSAARTAFDTMTQKLSQATLNTYLDYYDSTGNRRTPATASTFTPASYGRASDLQFLIRPNSQNGTGSISGNHGQEIYFQAPEAYSVTTSGTGLAPTTQAPNFQSVQGLLNSCGYYVAYGDNKLFQPTAFASASTYSYRYRLMQAMEPTENCSVFATSAAADTMSWLTNIQNTNSGPKMRSMYITPLADNIIALVVWPRLSLQDDSTGTKLTTNYTYDSQHSVQPTGSAAAGYTQPLTANQLPPSVQVTMVAISEPSVVHLNTLNGIVPSGSATAPVDIENALQGRFIDVTKYQDDVSSLISSLSLKHVSFQLFDATIALRESKWSGAP